MLSGLKCEGDLDGLVDQLRNATVPTPDLIRRIVTDACARLPVLKKTGKATNIDRLIEVGAWCDAATALIAIELPAWSIRRLVHEDGEWFCSLTRQPNLPIALDDTADANHQALPLAIFGAFLEARGRISAVRDANTPRVPQVRPTSGCAICCDNFA
jgi:hypothetical protein